MMKLPLRVHPRLLLPGTHYGLPAPRSQAQAQFEEDRTTPSLTKTRCRTLRTPSSRHTRMAVRRRRPSKGAFGLEAMSQTVRGRMGLLRESNRALGGLGPCATSWNFCSLSK